MRIEFYNQDNQLMMWCSVRDDEKTRKMIKRGYIEYWNEDVRGTTRLYFKHYARIDFI